MKKIFLSVVLMMCTIAVSAQQAEQLKTKRGGVKGYVTNGFWDNWELSVGGGVVINTVNGTLGGGDRGSFWHRLGYEVNVSGTKWFMPAFGARLQFQYGEFKNWDLATGETKVSTPSIFVHTDFMINLSNWIRYREDRAYYAVPFFGFGYQAVGFTDKYAEKYGVGTGQAFAFTAGWLNKFRVCDALDIDVELKGWLYRQGNLAPQIGGMNGGYATAFSTTVGLTYRFNKRDFDRRPSYSDEEVAAYLKAIADKDLMLAEAQAVTNQALADADMAIRNAAAAKAAAEKAIAEAKAKAGRVYVNGEGLTFFEIGQWTINDREKTRLDVLAKEIIASDPEKVYVIEGHADKTTGSAARNQKISDARAKAVRDYLVSKGVNEKQLQTKGMGDQHSPFGSAITNRVAIIK